MKKFLLFITIIIVSVSTAFTQIFENPCLNDTIYQYQFDSLNNKIMTSRTINTFDGSYNKIKHLQQNWDNVASQWDNSLKKDFTYDANNNVTGVVIQYWNSGSWQKSTKKDKSYDGNNNLTSYILYTWNGSSWNKATKISSTYNANNQVLVKTYSNWNTGTNSWDAYYRNTKTYDANGNNTKTLDESWVSGAWQNTNMKTVTFNGNDLVTNSISTSWNTGTNSWDNTAQTNYTYDVNNNLTKETSQNWNSGSWENNAQWTYTYNGSGDMILNLRKSWDSGSTSWVNNSKTTMTYDANDHLSERLRKSWFSGSWTPTNKIDYIYDSQGNRIKMDSYNIWVDSLGDFTNHTQTIYSFNCSNLANIVENSIDQNKIQVYPNPAFNYINIEVKNPGQFIIYDISGNVVKSFVVNSSTKQVSITDLKTGLYFLKRNGFPGTIKFIKK